MALQQRIYSNEMDNDRFLVAINPRFVLECIYAYGR